MSEHLDSSGGDEHLSLSPSSPSTDTNQQLSLAEKNLWNLSRKTMLSNAENDREEKEPFAGVNKSPSPSPSRSPSLSPSGFAPDKDLDASSFDPSKLDKSDGSPRSSRDNTPEKRPSSEREGSWERERTPEASPDENRKDKEAPISSSSESSLPESKPGGSTSTTSPAQPSTSASSSSPSDRKRKIELSEEELKIITKRHQKQDEERLKMQVLVSNFSEEQLNRYEMFRRATFPRAAIKRLMQNLTATSVSQNVVIAMSGISKVFVGEVLETALDVMEKWGETGPLHPKHLREAVRILKTKNMIPSTKGRKTLF